MICNFSSVAFYFFGLSIHWYSLAYIIGISIAWKLTDFFSKKTNSCFNNNLEDFINYAIVGIIIGGRIGHVLFYDFDYYFNNYTEILKVWKGGMSFFGGFIGVVIVTYLFCKKRKIDFLSFIDLWAISAPIGLFLGRIANFVNGELLGKETDIAWNVVFRDGVHRHPSQIYEAVLEGAALFIVMLLSFRNKFYKYKGRLSGVFCAGYGMARFFCEFFREPDSLLSRRLFLYTNLNLNQYLSMCIIILGFFLIYRSTRKYV